MPQGEIRRQDTIFSLSRLFRLAGFEPIDTPALEFAEILLGKAGAETEKQIYRFQDKGGRDVAMRFDLTVPFARYVSQHRDKLCFPFKRYHIAKVWRGENAQKGRYREFYQCDFDLIGEASPAADLLILQTVHSAFTALARQYPALSDGIAIHINHRGLLQHLCDRQNLSSAEQVQILRIIDKLRKIGLDQTIELLKTTFPSKTADTFGHYLRIGLNPNHIDFLTHLTQLEELLAPIEAPIRETLSEIRLFEAFSRQCGVPLTLDPTIARGLDYYTGMIFETFLTGLPALGSVCSGGRYDQLTQLYSTREMPGVGGSIGLDRLLAGIEELEKNGAPQPRGPLLLSADPALQAAGELEIFACLQLAKILQKNQLPCDFQPQVKKISSLFQQAEKKGSSSLILLKEPIPAKILTMEVFDRAVWQVRNLKSRESQQYRTKDLLLQKQQILSR